MFSIVHWSYLISIANNNDTKLHFNYIIIAYIVYDVTKKLVLPLSLEFQKANDSLTCHEEACHNSLNVVVQ